MPPDNSNRELIVSLDGIARAIRAQYSAANLSMKQAGTTAIDLPLPVVKEGWDWVNPNTGTTTTKSITFDTPFPSAPLNIELSVIGARTTSDPVTLTDFNVAIGGEILQLSVSSISRTGMVIQIYKNVNFSSSSVRYGFAWRVVGN